MPRTRSQRASQNPSLVGQHDPCDRLAGLHRFIAPALDQAQQRRRTGFQLLQGLPVQPGNHPGDQPTRFAHLDDHHQRGILIKGSETTAQIIDVRHGDLPRFS